VSASHQSDDSQLVVVIRHGETEWSKSGRHTGRTDLELDDVGRAEAIALAPALTAYPFELVLTSPLRRALETCRLAGFEDVAVVDDNLVEWDYGDVEGRTAAEMRAEIPGWTLFRNGVTGGERLSQVAARADRVIERIVATPGDVLLFAHGHVLRVLAARWMELHPSHAQYLHLDSATVSILGWKDRGRGLVTWNAPPAGFITTDHSLGRTPSGSRDRPVPR
jgi:probable phosphoglycerate mutase